MMYGYEGWGWPFVHGFGWLFMVMLTVLVVMGILALYRGMSRGSGGQESGDRAQAILRERYARGEITREQFDQMKRDLE
jgi:putative membrane protein